ncbi:hypothetical protein BASA62_003021 [Batrachochytrium salamandrivorans]|nr:hypothetical protein BASA62_003021 [Batrachochytrium salamandrivorans]
MRQQLLSTSLAHLVVECEQVTAIRIQSWTTYQQFRNVTTSDCWRRALDRCGDCIYVAPRWSHRMAKQDLVPPLVGTGTVEHCNLWGRGMMIGCAAATVNLTFLQVAYRQLQSHCGKANTTGIALWKLG